MTAEMLFVIAVILVMIVILALEVAPPELIVSGVALLFLLTGVLTFEETVAGFANESMLTIGLLFIIVGVIQKSNLLERIIDQTLGKGGSEKKSLVKLLFPVASLSAFLNNTPIVVALTPLVRKWCIEHNIAPSKFLIPLSYITILGGTITLIGTSTNLVVHGLMLESGMEGFGFFDLAIIGVPISLVGVLYLITIGNKLLPDNGVSPVDKLVKETRDYMCEFVVEKDYQHINKTVEEAGLRNLEGLFLVAIIRDEKKIAPVKASTIIEENDHLIFTGVLSTITELEQKKGLLLQTDTEISFNKLLNNGSKLIEVVVSDRSQLVFQKIQDTQFRGKYDAAIIAVHRNHERIKSKIGDIVLKPGDTLLLLTGADFLKKKYNNDFYVVTPLDLPATTTNNNKGAMFALIMLVSMIALVTLNVLSMFNAMAIITVILFVFRIISPSEAKEAIQFNVLLLVASSFSLGTALVNSGAAAWIANGLVEFSAPLGMLVVLFVIYLLTNIFTEIMSNTATVVIMFPLVLEMTKQLEIDPMAGIMLLTISASAAFATPIGYQTNLIVYGPGGYRFKDYIKVGIPLNILCMIVAVIIVYFVWII